MSVSASAVRETAPEPVGEWLRDCRELARFCTQNGWIDAESISHEVVVQQAVRLLIELQTGQRKRRAGSFRP